MSRRRDEQRDCTHRSTILGALLLLLLTRLSLGPPATAADGACAAAKPLPLNATVQRETGAPGADLYELALDEPGVLGLDVSAPIAAGSRPRLALLAADCAAPANGAESVRVRETPRGLVLRIHEAAALFLKVSPEDPDVPLAGYTLRSTFVTEPAVPDEVIRLVANPPAACSRGHVPTFTPTPFADSRFVVVERPSRLMKDVDPWEDDEISGLMEGSGVIVIEGDGTPPLDVSIHRDSGCGMKTLLAQGTIDGTGGFVAAAVHAGEQRLVVEGEAVDAGYDLYVRFFALCAADTDHDRPLCGAPLAVSDVASGTIDRATDDDYYTFTLDSQTTVAVEVDGEGVRGVLYDDRGQRLATWAGGLVRTLGAGRFHVRVGSVDGWVGEYAIGVEVIP